MRWTFSQYCESWSWYRIEGKMRKEACQGLLPDQVSLVYGLLNMIQEMGIRKNELRISRKRNSFNGDNVDLK